MTSRPTRKNRATKLKDWKRRQSEDTRKRLDDALDRFESGKLVNLPRGQKLTRKALAAEAGVSADTPFARYRLGHPQAGQYRFPEVVWRFKLLRKKALPRNSSLSLKKQVTELKVTNKHLGVQLRASRTVVNAQDIRIGELELRIREIEELLSEVIAERDSLEKQLKTVRRRRLKDASD